MRVDELSQEQSLQIGPARRFVGPSILKRRAVPAAVAFSLRPLTGHVAQPEPIDFAVVVVIGPCGDPFGGGRQLGQQIAPDSDGVRIALRQQLRTSHGLLGLVQPVADLGPIGLGGQQPAFGRVQRSHPGLHGVTHQRERLRRANGQLPKTIPQLEDSSHRITCAESGRTVFSGQDIAQQQAFGRRWQTSDTLQTVHNLFEPIPILGARVAQEFLSQPGLNGRRGRFRSIRH